MTNYFRADGLMLDGENFVVLKETNLTFVGATWTRLEGIVRHLSKPAMDRRLSRARYYSRVYELRTNPIESQNFYELKRQLYGRSKDARKLIENLDKNKFSQYIAGSLTIMNIAHEREIS